jgi:hypothetical protein
LAFHHLLQEKKEKACQKDPSNDLVFHAAVKERNGLRHFCNFTITVNLSAWTKNIKEQINVVNESMITCFVRMMAMLQHAWNEVCHIMPCLQTFLKKMP